MKRLALLTLTAALVVAVLVAATRVRTHVCGGANCAGAEVVVGADIYEFGGGSCQMLGGDFSVSLASDGVYFHLLRTQKDHGDYRSVVWHYSHSNEGVLLGATIKIGRDANGRTTGAFSGRNTKGVLTTGTFSCG